MSGLYLGIDTSCYTTSVACISDMGIVCDERTVLSVSPGERGLRQSEALFLHIKNLPPLLEKVFSAVEPHQIRAIGVSASPVLTDDSYMPVFLAGLNQARALAAALKVPLHRTAHQNGHIAAALIGNEKISEQEFCAIHLSGGTTDVLSIDRRQKITVLGASTDIHAGQFVDRVGVMLGCPFPCGKSLERLASAAKNKDIKIPSSVRGLNCSFSGAESFAARCLERGADGSEVAFAVYDCLSRTLAKLIEGLFERTKNERTLLFGGVASSRLLRELLAKRVGQRLYFAKPELSSDNAVGVAYLAMKNSITA
ncbi:MAG: FIST N-terminal domain-containing protein [Clostridia bacterium]|nr:FIST N-terminal domain-containing protein [Clostridia bacterium]